MERVLYYFEEICRIPHGSGNMEKIAQFCQEFAEKRGLWCHRDQAQNVMIKKAASPGREGEEPVILQGHLDMVCQKDIGVEIDFEKDGIRTFIEGDFLKARGTTLGGDDGIAIAMILAILERDDLSHPPIEALFTTDEEVGMIGAGKVDYTLLSGKRMVNLDSEQEGVITCSCAGGRDVVLNLPVTFCERKGDLVKISFDSFLGGHSGVDIAEKRENAICFMARFLLELYESEAFALASFSGGKKPNVIPSESEVLLLCEKGEEVLKKAEEILSAWKEEISSSEKNFSYSISLLEKEGKAKATDPVETPLILNHLSLLPTGVVEMSDQVPGQVQSSLNLGVMETKEEGFVAHFLLRSSLLSALSEMEEILSLLAENFGGTMESFGHYPPWEYRKESPLRDLYAGLYKEERGEEIKIEGIHAGLECGVFAGNIPDLDCIAIGPDLLDIHTTAERLSLSSTERLFKRLLRLLENL